MCGGGPSAPEDRSVELEQLRIADAERQRQREAEEEAAREAELAALRSDALGSARGSVNTFFNQQGVAPDTYSSTIESALQDILSGIPRDDPNPSVFFQGAGQRIFDDETLAQQNRFLRDINAFAPTGFATERIQNTLDDPYLASIEAEQRVGAEDILRNMLDRGVITNTGFQSGVGDLDRQTPLVRAQLGEIGQNQLEVGRGALRDIANTGREAASTTLLGQSFNPQSVRSNIDASFDEFLANLGSNIRANTTGNLFDTAGLAQIAGQAQSAQNTAFDPAALAGIIEEEEDEENRGTTSNTGTGVF